MKRSGNFYICLPLEVANEHCLGTFAPVNYLGSYASSSETEKEIGIELVHLYRYKSSSKVHNLSHHLKQAYVQVIGSFHTKFWSWHQFSVVLLNT